MVGDPKLYLAERSSRNQVATPRSIATFTSSSSLPPLCGTRMVHPTQMGTLYGGPCYSALTLPRCMARPSRRRRTRTQWRHFLLPLEAPSSIFTLALQSQSSVSTASPCPFSGRAGCTSLNAEIVRCRGVLKLLIARKHAECFIILPFSGKKLEAGFTCCNKTKLAIRCKGEKETSRC